MCFLVIYILVKSDYFSPENLQNHQRFSVWMYTIWFQILISSGVHYMTWTIAVFQLPPTLQTSYKVQHGEEFIKKRFHKFVLFKLVKVDRGWGGIRQYIYKKERMYFI